MERLFEDLHIQCCYTPISLSSIQRKELCIFSDASTVAIGAVAYLRAADTEGQFHVGFVMGKWKLAHTIPHLELGAVVLPVELYELLRDEMDIEVDVIKFFMDSKIDLNPAEHAPGSIPAAQLQYSRWSSLSVS